MRAAFILPPSCRPFFLTLLSLYYAGFSKSLAIQTPNGINEGMYVNIGGISQWVQIRGHDRANPVLLCLHGGPGATWLPLTALFVTWEKDFTIVQWDQRGAGKTLETTGDSILGTLTIARMTEDGLELSEFLRSHLHKEKIIVLGHSWGSILGIHMIKARPDLFCAYVGTGQVANLQNSMQGQYASIVKRAQAAGDNRTVRELESIGPPPYHDLSKARAAFQSSLRYGYEPESDRVAETSLIGRLMFGAPNFSLRDISARTRGFTGIPGTPFFLEVLNSDLPSLGTDFSVPIFFFQGTEDAMSESQLAKEYFDKINAPHKEYVAFDGGGHFAVWTMPDKFLNELLTRVRPLAVRTVRPRVNAR